MPIYKTARFKVQPDALPQCLAAIEEFIAYIHAHEPQTLTYVAWQEQADPTSFLHIFMFENPAAEEIHRTSEGVKRFTSILYPHLVDAQVTFTDYDLVAD